MNWVHVLSPRIYIGFACALALMLLSSCSPVTMPATYEYQLSAYSTKKLASKPSHISLLITAPEALAGYQTEQMVYVKKPYQLEAFAKNAWVDPPADMLFPLLVKSIQQSGYFYAVSSSPYVQSSDYRLDTQLLVLEQNFLHKPSYIDLSVKVVLTRVMDNKVLVSRIISQQIPCTQDTPYGGVLAANLAVEHLTAEVSRFVVGSLK